MKEPDLTRTREIIEMLDNIRDSVKDGCKDRCYISGLGVDSVKWVLELARDYLATYARLEISLKKISTNYRIGNMMEEVYGADSDTIKNIAKRVIEDELGEMIGTFIKYKDVEIMGTKYVYGSLYVGVDNA